MVPRGLYFPILIVAVGMLAGSIVFAVQILPEALNEGPGQTSARFGLALVMLAMAAVAFALARIRPSVGPARAGFGHGSPQTEQLDEFGDQDDPDVAGPSPDVLDLAPLPPARAGVEALRAADPGFSLPLWLEFANELMRAAWLARPQGLPPALRSWFSEGALESLSAGPPDLEATETVQVGRARVVHLLLIDGVAFLEAEVEALLTERHGGESKIFFTKERWSFARGLARPSPGPGRQDRLVCPACGEPSAPDAAGACSRCSAPRLGGEQAWEVRQVLRQDRGLLQRPPLELGHRVEHGTSLPTVAAPHLATLTRGFAERHPDHDLAVFTAWAQRLFAAIAQALDAGDLGPVRPSLHPAAARALELRLARLRLVGLKERRTEVVVDQAELARLDEDAWFELATLRIPARQREWIEDQHGQAVGGDPQGSREFSEYWTFLRPRDLAERAAAAASQGWRLWKTEADEDYDG